MLCGFLIHYASGHAAYYNDICTPCRYDWTIQYTFPKPVSNKAGDLRVNVTCRCVRVTFSRGQAISIQYSEYVSLALVARRAKCMSRIISCTMCVSTLFFHVVSYTAHFQEKKKLLNVKCVFWFTLQHSSEKISHSKKNCAKCDHKFT
jgi:hypothetical protein